MWGARTERVPETFRADLRRVEGVYRHTGLLVRLLAVSAADSLGVVTSDLFGVLTRMLLHDMHGLSGSDECCGGVVGNGTNVILV